jgi:hypothetical protein
MSATGTYLEHFCNGQRVAKCATCGQNRPARYIGTDEPCLTCDDIADSARLRAQKKEWYASLNGPKSEFDVSAWVRI